MRKKKGKKIVSILAATIMTVSVIFGALASGSTPAYAAEFSSDTASATDWVKYLEDKEGNLSTETVGRIWTDKTVSKDSITFEGSGNGNLKVDKQKDSDFLVALSAMSSTSNIMTKPDKPLDVVLVLDMSGSMADEEQINKYEYTPIYESELNTRNTYYLEDEKKLKYDSSKGWYYETGFIFTQKHYVKPKTGPNDKDSSHVQFHTRKLVTVTIDKLPALKKAVNGFIDSTAKINEGIRDDSKKHRISLVKFAGNTTDRIGNNTYRDGGYTYNYSQIVNKLTSDTTTVKKNFNELTPAGATRADYGLNHAVTVLNDKDSRPNAQKVVIFFTDGQPTSSSGFETEVANSAIRSAKTIKDSNTLIYTLGIFADADAEITDDQFNAYMQGVSSNYPEATAYNKLGARAEGSNYYKVAKNADDLNNIFTDIAGEIQTSAQGAPTQIKDGYDTNKSGYITFKDQLGQYVKCDGFTDIVFAGKQFKNPNISSEDEGENTVTTYTFSGTGSNNLYPDGDLADIIIKVTSYKELSKGDYVEVKIPASLIPVRNFNITDGKMTVTETHPIRILYNASVKDGVVEDLKDEGGKVIKPALVKNPDVDFNEYLRDAKNKTTDGKVKFFSNMWSGGDNGDTTATFEPSVTNSFYRFTDDAQLFIKTPTGKEPVTSIGNIHKSNTDEYFFEKTYYTAATSGGSVTTETEPSYIRITDTSNLEQWMVERDGKVFIKKGTERLLRIDDFTNKEKDNNTTQTAKYVINPIWDSNRTNIIAHLGNNGVATAQVGGAISVSKTAKLAEGMIGPVDSNGKSTLDEQEFTFEIDAKGTADGEYTSVIYKTGADGTESKGEYNTVTFKDGKTTDVKIENGLFENKYNAEVDFGKIGANFNITKSLSGRDMAQDQFSFEVKALDADSEKALNIPKSGETVKSPAANMGEDAIVKVIDKLRFTEKDSNKTYGFTVRELGKAQVGYVYDETMYTVKIKVDDLANGKLKATAKVLAGEKLVGEYTWTPDSEDVKPVVLSFENAYSADNNNSPAVVEATKTMNGRHLKAEEFNFQIKDVKGTVVREAKNAANGTVDFGKGFTYNINDLNEMVKSGLATKKVEDGKNVFTISYTAEEVGNMPAAVTMTAGNFSFNIKVTDNGDGTLATDVVYPEGGIRFVNTYATGTDGNNEAPLQIIGNKVISAEDGLVPPAIDGKFSFTMTGDENAPLPEKATVTNDGAGQIAFGNIKYTLYMLKDVEPTEDGSRSRTFNYTVTESGVVPGITNDDNNTRTFSVTLKDDGVGNLTATPSDSARFTFTNTYGVVVTDPTSITDQIKISKKLTGRELVAEEFKFELVNSENKVVATGTNDAKGKIVFTPMTYDKPGNFTYTVREVANEEYDGVDYDETLFTVNTEVKDNSDGTLSVTHSVDGAEVVFNNKYSTGKTSVVIGAAKKFIGSDLKGGQFKFELKDENGKLVSAAVNDKDGNIIFDEITYDKEGTYKYTISEVNSGDKNVKFDDTVFEVTVKVTDDKKGNLVAKAETEDADGVVFVNTYEKPQEPQTPHQSDDGAKTGDDTPINALVVFMGAAILLMGTLIERRKTN